MEKKVLNAFLDAYKLDNLPFLSLQVLDLIQTKETRELYAGIPIVNPPGFKYPEETLRDYHHSVLVVDPHDPDPFVAQLDPYGLIYKQHDMEVGNFELLRNGLTPDSAATVTDNSVECTFRKLGTYFDELLRLSHKSPGFGRNKGDVKSMIDLTIEHMDGIYESGSSKTVANILVDSVVVAQYAQLAKKLGALNCGISCWLALKILIFQLCTTLSKKLEYNSKL